jgi:hypothetical protein
MPIMNILVFPVLASIGFEALSTAWYYRHERTVYPGSSKELYSSLPAKRQAGKRVRQVRLAFPKGES